MLTINNIAYNVIRERDAEACDADGHHNTARQMREKKVARQLVLVRPSGKKMFSAVQYENGKFSAVSFLGYL